MALGADVATPGGSFAPITGLRPGANLPPAAADGVTTHKDNDPLRQRTLVVPDKKRPGQVRNFHHGTLHALQERRPPD
jgi:hypothetical protein